MNLQTDLTPGIINSIATLTEWGLSLFTLQEWAECQQIFLDRISTDLPEVISLPCLACQATGASFSVAIPVAIAWSLLRYSADLHDAIQDRDIFTDEHKISSQTGYANGLIFAAFDAIGEIPDPETVQQTMILFSQAAFQATQGEFLCQKYRKLDCTTLEMYWQATILKSGSIFRAGLGGGALAGKAPDHFVAALCDFGTTLGVIRQIIDDCRDVFDGTKDSTYEITLPLLLLAIKQETPMAELTKELRSPKALSATLKLEGIPEIIASILLEWHQRGMESLMILDHNPGVEILKLILENFVTKPWLNPNL